MSQVNVVRAWKDEEYRNSLSAAERAALPDNPAGVLQPTDDELRGAEGGGFGTFNGCIIQTLVQPCPIKLPPSSVLPVCPLPSTIIFI